MLEIFVFAEWLMAMLLWLGAVGLDTARLTKAWQLSVSKMIRVYSDDSLFREYMEKYKSDNS